MCRARKIQWRERWYRTLMDQLNKCKSWPSHPFSTDHRHLEPRKHHDFNSLATLKENTFPLCLWLNYGILQSNHVVVVEPIRRWYSHGGHCEWGHGHRCQMLHWIYGVRHGRGLTVSECCDSDICQWSGKQLEQLFDTFPICCATQEPQEPHNTLLSSVDLAIRWTSSCLFPSTNVSTVEHMFG